LSTCDFLSCTIQMTIHFSLSLSEVSYKSSHSSSQISFLSSSTLLSSLMWNLLIDTFQHWLLYDKLSSNNINNYHHVSVVQICVSKLTTCRVLVLYNAYIAVLICVNTDVNSVLEVDQQQLALYTHFSQTMIILTLLSDNVLFVQNCITSNQMRTHQLLYINAILIQSQTCWFLSVVLTVKNVIWCSFENVIVSKHFNECCSNCKWHDHAAHCSVCNNDVLIVILNDENNNSINEWVHC
jgi:hypothetical protein